MTLKLNTMLCESLPEAHEWARRLSEATGNRFRVQPARWLPWRFWYVSPTPAPAPERIGAEPCS